jgi:hypothetical protein
MVRTFPEGGSSDDDTTDDGGSSGGTTDGGGWGPFTTAQIDWLKSLVNNPRKTIMGFVLTWAVSRILMGVEWTIGAIIWFADGWADAMVAVWGAVAYPISTVAPSIFSVVLGIHGTAIGIVESLGIAALPASVVIFAIEVFGLLWLADFAIRVGVFSVLSGVPILGSVLSVLETVYNTMKTAFIRAYRVVVDA